MTEKKSLSAIIDAALKEDTVFADITTKILIPKNAKAQAYILSKENAVICGSRIVSAIFKKFDPKVRVVAYHKDGDAVLANEPVIFLKGPARSILSAERVALNFLGHLSGIATLTRRFVEQTKGTKAKILDTRKTTPGLRDLEKYAVRCGGGENHRRDLSEMVLIKDNHHAAHDRPIADVIALARRNTKKRVEVEVDTLEQFAEALKAKPDIILLDNMTLRDIKGAVALKNTMKSKSQLEASGGINLNNIAAVAKTGVDRISIGALTHSAVSVNFSLDFVI